MLRAIWMQIIGSGGSVTTAKGRQWQYIQKDPIGKDRISREADRLGTQGEERNQPPLGVAATILPYWSMVSKWQVSPL